ncbi:glycosyltransferase family 4 protein [bacterium]|nr:glycosyltransferase family 4 protein [bacterium]
MTTIFINGRFLTQPTTGVQRYALELVRQWDRGLLTGKLDPDQWDFQLLVPSTDLVQDPQLKRIPVQQAGSSNGQVWEQIDLPGLSSTGILFCPCNSAPLRSLYGKQPTIVTVHDLSTKYFPDAYSGAFRLWYDILMPAVFKHAQRIITVAQCERKSMAERYPRATPRIRVVQNGSIEPAEAIALGQGVPRLEDPHEPFLLYVGSMSRRKNVQGVLAAADLLTEEFPLLKTVIIGGQTKVFADGPWEISSRLRERLIHRGQVDDVEELFWFYRHARCFLFPSFFEASPLPPMEAMAAGCPVVASAIPSHHERLGDAALYCDPNDAGDIARRAAQILRDPGLANGLMTRGWKRAAEFTWARCADETLRIIDEVAHEIPGPRKRKKGRAA